MENDVVIKIRDNMRKITVKTSKGQVVPVPLVIKLDNEAYVKEKEMDVLWDDDNAILYYYSYNQRNMDAPIMMGTDKANVPGILSSAGYGEIQEIYAKLTADALESSFDMLSATTAKPHYMPGDTFTDKMKQRIRQKLTMNTRAARDIDFYDKDYTR